MKLNTSSVAAHLGDPGPFYRSVSLERDREDAAAARGYVLTPWLERVAAEILEGLLPGSRRRAWRITGDFGVGKSALGLALLRALDPRSANSKAPMGQFIGRIEGELPRMYPVVVIGSRDGLTSTFASCISEVLEAEQLSLDRKYRKALEKGDPFQAVLGLRDALVQTKQYDGVLVIVDEMGKFLEAAAADAASGDVFRLQELAEAASRSGTHPIALLLLLHQGFQSYSEDGPTALRSEWAKVAERFDELVFDHPLSHTSALLSAALRPDVKRLPAATVKAYRQAEAAVADLGWFGPRSAHDLEPCYPLHPAAVPVLARFFAAYGQNERSLFGFAASEEANGLRAFAAQALVGDGFYGIDRFFDYVTTSFGHRLVARGGTGDWERIRSVLDGASERDATETAVLKVVGLLNLLDVPDLVADPASLVACLRPAHESSQVEAAIERLRMNGVLFERVGKGGFRLWTSHRVDLSLLWANAGKAISMASVVKDLPRTLSTLPVRPFLLARRHSIETGVTRRFPIRMLPASALAGSVFEHGADGSITAIIPGNATEAKLASTWACEATRGDPMRLVAVMPVPTAFLLPALDLLRHRWIEANATVLREDAHASAEIDRRITELEGRLVDQMEAALGISGTSPGPGVLISRNGTTIKEPRVLHLIVSEMCDDLYGQSPLIHNELVNRHSLTSAAAKGRQSLIDAMFDRTTEPDLGFVGTKNPPERALYLSFLKRGRVHRELDGEFGLALPEVDDDPLRLRPALLAVNGMLSGGGERVALVNIHRMLADRPFGVRAGLAPLLLAIILVANRHRIALFERGTYCPKFDSQAFMRILKAPENFTVQWVALEGVRADVYKRLASVLGGGDANQGLMAVVAPLVKFGAGLSFHAQRSSTLGKSAQAVRDALLRASSPVNLIFDELPRACGLDPFGHAAGHDSKRAATFVKRFQAAVAELQSCYPSLLEAMRTQVRDALAVTGDLRAQLQERARPLLFNIKEQVLRTFTQRIADDGLADDAWTEALGGALVGKPPSRWLAQDVAVWRAKLSDVAATFVRTEAVAFGSASHRKNAVRFALTYIDGRERAAVVGLKDETEDEAAYVQTLIKQLEEGAISPYNIIARLAERFMAETASENVDLAKKAAS